MLKRREPEALGNPSAGWFSKLTDLELVIDILENHTIHQWRDEPQHLELDITSLDADEAARQICTQILDACRDLVLESFKRGRFSSSDIPPEGLDGRCSDIEHGGQLGGREEIRVVKARQPIQHETCASKVWTTCRAGPPSRFVSMGKNAVRRCNRDDP